VILRKNDKRFRKEHAVDNRIVHHALILVQPRRLIHFSRALAKWTRQYQALKDLIPVPITVEKMLGKIRASSVSGA